MGPDSDTSNEEPEIGPDFVEIMRCARGGDQRSYQLRAMPGGGAEMWRVTTSKTGGQQRIKESDFRSSEQAVAFLGELRRSLVAGGWTQM